MKFYYASPHASAPEIEVIDSASCVGGYALKPRHDLATEYGPAQIAIALIADATGDDQKALTHYKAFCMRVLLPFQNHEWELSQEDVRQAVMDIERDHPHRHTETARGKAGRRI
jgi:hypothetical protein